MEKQQYIDRLNSKLNVTKMVTITVNFNDVLQNDLDGRYFVYDAEFINTPKAELLTEGKTWGTPTVSFQIEVPEHGKELCFMALGLNTAQYTRFTTTIYPNDEYAHVFLQAEPETHFSPH